MEVLPVVTHQAATQRRAPQPSSGISPAARKRILAVLALAVVLAGVGAFALWTRPGSRPAPSTSGQLRAGLFISPDQPASEVQQTLDHYVDLGVNHVTVAAALFWLCPTPACDVERLDDVVDSARDRGMTVALQVNTSPDWLDSRGVQYAPDTVEARGRWVALARQLAVHFGTRVSYYEVWNEPDNPQFWRQGPDAAGYAALLHDTFLALKSVAPDITVVGGNFAGNNLGYLQAMYAAMERMYGDSAHSSRYYFDVLGLHPYAGSLNRAYSPTDTSKREQISSTGIVDRTYLGYRQMHAAVKQQEGMDKDLAFGEFGYSTTPGYYGPVADQIRARWLADAFRLAGKDGYVRYLTWFDYEPGGDDPGFGIRGTLTEQALRSAATAISQPGRETSQPSKG